MMQILKYFSVLIVACVSCIILTSCENDIQEVRALDKKVEDVELIKGLTSFMSDGGVVKGELKAPIMRQSKSDSGVTEFPKSLTILMFDTATKVTTRIFAKYGRYITSTNKIFLKDSVVIATANKDTIRTSELYYDQTGHRIYTDKPIWIHQYNPQEQYIYAKKGMTTSDNFINRTLYDAQVGSFLKYSESALGPGGL